VPRYTSYPTAPHFSNDFNASTYESWLATLDPREPISLYGHIPFCDSMCWFCGCYTKIVQKYKPVSDYLEFLKKEAALIASRLPGRFSIRHLHWGGGSPTMVHSEDWRAVFDQLSAVFDFTPDAELAMELDPRDVSESDIAGLAALGVNRVSIGVQDFDPTVQAAVNRIQPFDLVAHVCNWLRENGIEKINFDLMYGLPHQDETRVVAMVEKAVKLQPSRIALFGYAHVPWMRTHQKLIDEAALPTPVTRLEHVNVARKVLEGHGYHSVGLDHFAHGDDHLSQALDAGQLRRNFQGYTTDAASTLIGLGASAIGDLPQGYVQNAAPMKEYVDAVSNEKLPVKRGLALTAEDRLRRSIIERLMCDLSVDLDVLCASEGNGADAAPLDECIAALAPLAADGIVQIDGRRIVINEEGRPFTRLVAAAFDAYHANSSAGHSLAV
jgi:oxygen-independent coproporphyrinogen-3 oxidase